MRNIGMCLLNIYIDVPLFHTYTMKNIHFNPVSTTLHNTGHATIINVNSKYYDSDINYQKSIDETFKKVIV